MTTEERLIADYSGTGLTIRQTSNGLSSRGPAKAMCLFHSGIENTQGRRLRQDGRHGDCTPETRHILSIEDETGIANVIVTPDLYERERLVVTRAKFIQAEGPLQNQDGVIHVKALRLCPLSDQTLEVRSHDFH